MSLMEDYDIEIVQGKRMYFVDDDGLCCAFIRLQ
jgi:hypothetical protein